MDARAAADLEHVLAREPPKGMSPERRGAGCLREPRLGEEAALDLGEVLGAARLVRDLAAPVVRHRMLDPPTAHVGLRRHRASLRPSVQPEDALGGAAARTRARRAPVRPRPGAARAPGRAAARRRASASAATSPGGTSRPVSPSTTASGVPPTAVATTGLPRAIASSTTSGSPSTVDGRQSVVSRRAAQARRRGSPRRRRGGIRASSSSRLVRARPCSRSSPDGARRSRRRAATRR